MTYKLPGLTTGQTVIKAGNRWGRGLDLFDHGMQNTPAPKIDWTSQDDYA